VDIKTRNKKTAVGLSGGVDSAVSAHLLKQAGYDVVGVYMRCWRADFPGCTADQDKAAAVAVAAHLDIHLEELDFIDAYKQKVISYFYSEYRAGRTPNPDVMCNREIKFGLFFEWAMENGFDYVATGHYARVASSSATPTPFPSSAVALSRSATPSLNTIAVPKYEELTKVLKDPNTYYMLSGVDPKKDQSYFLYVLEQEHLKKIIFPLGELEKTRVREIAKDIGLPNASRPDSTGICFIGEVDIKKFLEIEIPQKEGNVVNMAGEVIGTHSGAHYFTLGQRHGFTVEKYQGIPLYVVSKDVVKNELVVGTKEDASSAKFFVTDLHWISGVPKFPFNCLVRIRHLGEFYECVVENVQQMSDVGESMQGAGLESGQKQQKTLKVTSEKPIFAVSSGQSTVFYKNDVVLGGGVIV
jgi:tRNA-uridine 2-sulfurtransferase